MGLFSQRSDGRMGLFSQRRRYNWAILQGRRYNWAIHHPGMYTPGLYTTRVCTPWYTPPSRVHPGIHHPVGYTLGYTPPGYVPREAIHYPGMYPGKLYTLGRGILGYIHPRERYTGLYTPSLVYPPPYYPGYTRHPTSRPATRRGRQWGAGCGTMRPWAQEGRE